MPKQKTNRSALKRFKMTKSGKIRRTRSGRRKLNAGKSRKRKRNLRRPEFVSAGEHKTFLRLLGEA